MPRPLDPTNDRTVSRLMVAREKRGRASLMSRYRPFAQGFHDLVGDRFGSGRKLTGVELAALTHGFERAVDGHPQKALQRFDGNQGPTRTRPKGEWFERGRIHVEATERGFKLVSTSLALGRKRALTETAESCLSWTDHAAARFYERAGGDEPQEATIGGALMDAFFAASMAAHAIGRHGLPPYLAIPCDGGLLLGSVEWETGERSGYGVGSAHERGETTSYLPSTVSYTTEDREDAQPRWRADTFIGQRELRPNQCEYLHAWQEMAAAPFVRHMSRSTARIAAARRFMDAGQMAHLIAEFTPYRDAMARFLSETWVQYAVGKPDAVDAWLEALSPVAAAGTVAADEDTDDVMEEGCPAPRFGT